MKIIYLLAFLAGPVAATEINYPAADGTIIYADWYMAENPDAATVVLFHQAGGSAKGEYPNIITRLRERGVNILAVDQRSGGDRFGPGNRTVDALGGAEIAYCEAWPDLLASVDQAAKLDDGPIIAWGSSYSAGLVLRLAALHDDKITAALAFSPASGGPMEACNPAELIDQIHIPVAAFRPAREMEIASVVDQAAALRNAGVQFHVIEGGVHGSSMLDPDRSAADMDMAWHLVDEFLSPFLSP